MSVHYSGLSNPMVDSLTKASKSINTDHSYIHDGWFFEASVNFPLASSGVGNIIITTPAAATGTVVHYRNEIITTSADKVVVQLYEGATYTGGSAANIKNHNRLSSIAAGVTVLYGVTVTDAGTLLVDHYIGGGTATGQARSGAELGDKNEWVLRQNTVYLVRLTNNSSGTNVVYVNPIWYEEV